jgi:hypothetical protein
MASFRPFLEVMVCSDAVCLRAAGQLACGDARTLERGILVRTVLIYVCKSE